ncbi:hypothetical protein BGW42_007722, partial [Actinomortierella wolfii]
MDTAVNDLHKERIIFAVDLDSSMEEYFYAGDKKNEMRITRTKQLIKRFVEQKSMWNKQHEFALMILGQNAVWHIDFTREVGVFKYAVDELFAMGSYSSFDPTSLFEEVLKRGMLNVDDGYITRVILIYTRSNVIPSQPRQEVLLLFFIARIAPKKVREVMTELHASGKFHFDCIYIHNRSSEVKGDIKPQMVYDRLTELEDQQVPGYFFEMTRLFRKYTTAMTQLLANPTQRIFQETSADFDYMLPKPPSVRKQEEELQRKRQQEQERQQKHSDDIQILNEPPKTIRTNAPPSTLYYSSTASSASAGTTATTATGPATRSVPSPSASTTATGGMQASTSSTPKDTSQDRHRYPNT